ncbi:MAG TPA: hypothetical protein PKH39_18590 [Woeseiaceae bacterium]|nr:hypothetical protein [Woeseiaceae bacterium]
MARTMGPLNRIGRSVIAKPCLADGEHFLGTVASVVHISRLRMVSRVVSKMAPLTPVLEIVEITVFWSVIQVPGCEHDL